MAEALGNQEAQYDIPVDFEINDGLDKLQQATLLNQDSEQLSASPLHLANEILQQQWIDLINQHTTSSRED